MTPVEILLLILLIFTTVVIGCKVWLKRSTKERSHKKSRRIFRSKHFMKLINQGFRVYDVYCTEAGGGFFCGYFKFSVLSKRPLSNDKIDSLSRMSCCIEFQLKNTAAKNCKYITFNGKELCEFNSKTGKISRTRSRETTIPISRKTFNKAVDIYNRRSGGADKMPYGTLVAGDGR